MMRLRRWKWVGVVVITVTLACSSLAGASEKAEQGKALYFKSKHNEVKTYNKSQVKPQVPPASNEVTSLNRREAKELKKDEIRARYQQKQALQAEIRQQAVQVKQLSQEIKQLNQQLQQELKWAKKNKIQLTASEVERLRQHLQAMRTNSQKLTDSKEREGQWRQTELEVIKREQAQRIQELTALRDELKQLTRLLAATKKR